MQDTAPLLLELGWPPELVTAFMDFPRELLGPSLLPKMLSAETHATTYVEFAREPVATDSLIWGEVQHG